jgi:hypothetical protein
MTVAAPPLSIPHARPSSVEGLLLILSPEVFIRIRRHVCFTGRYTAIVADFTTGRHLGRATAKAAHLAGWDAATQAHARGIVNVFTEPDRE